MRKRYQQGSVVKSPCGRYWLGKYRDASGRSKTRSLGKCKGAEAITKSLAREQLAEILSPINSSSTDTVFADCTVKDFIETVYFPFYRRKWRPLTAESRTDSINRHIVGAFGDRALSSINRDEIQMWLDNLVTKADPTKLMAYTTVDHLRWDVKQILDLAVAEGIIPRNPVFSGKMLLSVPRECPQPTRPVMSVEDVKRAMLVLDLRERVVFKLAVLTGMRVSEIFGLRRGSVHDDYVEVLERVCRRDIDKPKGPKAERKAALTSGIQKDLRSWLDTSLDTGPDGWLFPSETLKTPIGSDNFMSRYLRPQLEAVGLRWVDYRVMRRTHSSLMNERGIDPKLVQSAINNATNETMPSYIHLCEEPPPSSWTPRYERDWNSWPEAGANHCG